MSKKWGKRSFMDRIGICISLIFCGCLFLLIIYGTWSLYTRESRLDLKEFRRSEIARLETKVMFLENTDWAHAIQQLPPEVQGDLALGNAMIKQGKERKFKENYEETCWDWRWWHP